MLLRMQTPTLIEQQTKDDKAEVAEYFNTVGFDRWNKIYSESTEVNKVQLDIREGHQQTVDRVLQWLDQDRAGKPLTESVCDAGCGVGSLSLPLLERGASVYATDISAAMVEEAEARAKSLLVNGGHRRGRFETKDLESLGGSYDTVMCIDVMIHYPTEKMEEMVMKLASLADRRLIISFAPDTWYYSLLKKVGEFFPGPSKTTRAYLHEEGRVKAALAKAGFTVRRDHMTATNFYFSRLFEAVRQ